jgi:hypothetical protein
MAMWASRSNVVGEQVALDVVPRVASAVWEPMACIAAEGTLPQELHPRPRPALRVSRIAAARAVPPTGTAHSDPFGAKLLLEPVVQAADDTAWPHPADAVYARRGR